MISRRSAGVALALAVFGGALPAAHAGWPFGKSNNCCPVCEAEQPKPKKKSLMSADDAPSAGVVDLIPARYTTVRADRKTDDKKDAPADIEKMEQLEKKLKALDTKVNQLSLEIEALVHVLENKK